VFDIYGVRPDEVRYLKALSGDSSDNVVGIRGIGDKTAAKIVLECRCGDDSDFSVADRIVMHPKVKDHADTFLSNLRVVTMVDDLDVKWFANTPPAEGVVRSVFEQSEFGSFLKDARFKKILKALRATS
jgi:DNA polymerase-1